jgi:hypothetical protein
MSSPIYSNKEYVEHAAFLAMWLSIFVLKEAPFNIIAHRNVFYIAARMARGQGMALKPLSTKLHISRRYEEEFVTGTPLTCNSGYGSTFLL